MSMQGLVPPKPSSLQPDYKLSDLAVQLDVEKALANKEQYNIDSLLQFQRL